MLIKSIQFDGGRWTISYVKENSNGFSDEHVLKSEDISRPEFEEYFHYLDEILIEEHTFLSLAKSQINIAEKSREEACKNEGRTFSPRPLEGVVKKISFKYDSERDHVTSFILEGYVRHGTCALNVKTHGIWSGFDKEDGYIISINNLLEEAGAYARGVRAQTALFDEED